MKSKQEILDIINHSIGTTAYHQFSSFPDFPVVTDGVIEVAQAAECFWLLDLIGGNQKNPKLDKNFQVWELKVDWYDRSAVLCGYNDTTLIITVEIPCTDFPLDEFKVYVMNGVILLPNEY